VIYNGTDNDHAMSHYLLARLKDIIRMEPAHYPMQPSLKNFTVMPYQSTHNACGTIMGSILAEAWLIVIPGFGARIIYLLWVRIRPYSKMTMIRPVLWER
jgi:hypothetical protein